MQTLKFLTTVVFLLLTTILISQEKTKVLLDADTANEVDDAFALSIILMDSTVEVTALNATQWQASHWTTPKSMEDSYRLNEMLLGIMGVQVKTNRGGAERMYDWGDRAQHSAAAYEIIKQAKAKPNGEKLNIIALGALTNVASAVFIDPSIAKKLNLYWLGTTYDFDSGILRKDDFNCAMDQYALTHLLFSEVEMHIIPVSVANQITFKYSETRKQIENHFLGDFLLKIWDDHVDGGRTQRTLWDLTIVYAFLHPEWMQEVEITTSKDSGGRKIFYYKDFDAEQMRTDFYAKINTYARPN